MKALVADGPGDDVNREPLPGVVGRQEFPIPQMSRRGHDAAPLRQSLYEMLFPLHPDDALQVDSIEPMKPQEIDRIGPEGAQTPSPQSPWI
jgi:hypothetical protein